MQVTVLVPLQYNNWIFFFSGRLMQKFPGSPNPCGLLTKVISPRFIYTESRPKAENLNCRIKPMSRIVGDDE
jgi:hypothetical protein